MANVFYAKGIEAFLEGSIAALSDTIKVSLVTTGYTPNTSTDQYYNIISGGNITAAGVALGSKSGAGGALSAANLIWTSVSGSASAYVIVWKDTGTSSTSPLICIIDTATGLPVTPNGGDITVAWSGGVVFTLKQSLSERDRIRVTRWLAQRWKDLGKYVGWNDRRVWIPEGQQILVPTVGF